MLVDVTSAKKEQAQWHIDTITSALSMRTKAAKRADCPPRAGQREPQRAIKPTAADYQTHITESGHAAYALFRNAYW